MFGVIAEVGANDTKESDDKVPNETSSAWDDRESILGDINALTPKYGKGH